MMRYLITPTLLNSWAYYMGVDEEYQDSAKADFLRTLSRESFQPTEAMQKGNKFEADVFAYVDGFRPTLSDEYWECVSDIAYELVGGVRQLAVKTEIMVGDVSFLLYGKVDHLAGPWATDIKFTGNYDFPKFKDSAQHPLYLACLPAVPSFRYLISDGHRTYEEVYQRSECRPVAEFVSEFIGGIQRWDEAWKLFDMKWQAYE